MIATTTELSILDAAIVKQTSRMVGYQIQSEALLLETVRALDYAYFKGLIPELKTQRSPSDQEISIMRWGVNEAIYRVFPKKLLKETRVFGSSRPLQEQADSFLFDAGTLALAKRQRLLLSRGLLRGYIDPRKTRGSTRILVLEAENQSVYWDAIGQAGMSWLSARAWQEDRTTEVELERRHMDILPQLSEYLSQPSQWEKVEPFEGCNKHFYDWATIYLRRMVYRDLLADEDRIGGYRYADFVSVLTVISAMCQMRICYAGIMHSNRLRLDIRNVLTGGSLLKDLCERVADFLDADSKEVSELLDHLILSPRNHEYQLQRGALAWAPLIRASDSFCILPSYGLDINPFLFLLHELRTRYEKDWFDLVNRREARWVKELESLFPEPRWRYASGANLKRSGKLVTDIDFVAFDTHTRQLALFQLKWQQPSLSDERVRQSNGWNFVDACNKWVDDVQGWLLERGVGEFLRRMTVKEGTIVEHLALFVVARYSAHFPTVATPNSDATWSDWAHLQKHRLARPEGSISDLELDLRVDIKGQQLATKPESFMLPLPELALILNPTRSPWKDS